MILNHNYLYHNKGIYTCNEKFFCNKLDAILEANTSGKWIEWDYHDATFSQHNWSANPPVELDELYRQRALQLREAYDHLVLFYSGGVDSWYILNAFIKNNIRLDEIYMYGAFSAEEKMYSTLGNDRTPGYYTREIQKSLPLIKKLAQENKIKVSVYDWGQDMVDAANNRDWFLETGSRYDPTSMARGQFHKVFRHHNELVHKGKRVGFLFGVDKPRLLRDDHNIYFSFLDIIMPRGALSTNDILGEYWENDEYFYWSPNLPELIIKQSHIIVQYLKMTNQLELIPHLKNAKAGHSEQYYRAVNHCIYPDWNLDTWQIKKPTSDVQDQVGQWFLDTQPEAVHAWKSSIYELERLCGNQWFNNDSVMHGFRGHLSPMYKIADYTLPLG